jgi:hypothetical protein
MRVKSRYRRGGAVPVTGETQSDRTAEEVIAGNGHAAELPPEDDASTRLTHSLRAVEHAEQAQAELLAQLAAAKQMEVEQASTPLARWKAAHPEVETDRRVRLRAAFAHEDAIDAGLRPNTEAYLSFLDQQLGFNERPAPETPLPMRAAPPERRIPVSAPVSRSAPGGAVADDLDALLRGRVKLTPEQREAAKVSGISEAEYSRQLVRVMQAKRRGEMQGGG